MRLGSAGSIRLPLVCSKTFRSSSCCFVLFGVLFGASHIPGYFVRCQPYTSNAGHITVVAVEGRVGDGCLVRACVILVVRVSSDARSEGVGARREFDLDEFETSCPPLKLIVRMQAFDKQSRECSPLVSAHSSCSSAGSAISWRSRVGRGVGLGGSACRSIRRVRPSSSANRRMNCCQSNA